MDGEALLTLLQQEGITDPRVLAAIRQIPREKFVLLRDKENAYQNIALPIHCDQTISQPYIVALMTQALLTHPHPDRILEIGTGSGYQTAILALLFKEIFTIERIKTLSQEATQRLNALGFDSISYQWGDGYQGWPTAAPFDAIIVTAAAQKIPPTLFNQLSDEGGLMVIPLGHPHRVQKLTLIRKKNKFVEEQVLEKVNFVPLIPDPHQ